MTRQISPAALQRAAEGGLARLACEYGDPTYPDPEHHHTEVCLHDDIAWAADRSLRLLMGIAVGDDDLILQMLTDLQTAVSPDAGHLTARR